MLEGSIGSSPQFVLENVQYTDEKLNELIQELYSLWEQSNIPENHKIYYIESINSMSKFDAIEKLLKEVHEFKIAKSNIQSLMKITRGREKCLQIMRNFYKEMQSDMFKNNVMQYMRKLSEYISHLRILSINLVETFHRWTRDIQNNTDKYYEWVYKEWNYLIKMQLDTQFIQNTLSIVNQYFEFSKIEDPFHLSIIRQANRIDQGDLEYYDYLTQQRVPKTLIHRIRKCEVIMMEENVKRKIHLSGNHELLIKYTNLEGYQSEPIKKYQKDVLFQFENIQLCMVHLEYKELEDYFRENYEKNCSKHYKLTFDTTLQGNLQDLLYSQECYLISGFVMDKEIGCVIVKIDVGNVVTRRWIIQSIICQSDNYFKQLISGFIHYIISINDDFEEVQISLNHEDINGVFTEVASFKQCLKEIGFKWKQQVNNSDTNQRFIIYLLKKQNLQSQAITQNINNKRQGNREPITCLIGIIDQQTPLTSIADENVLLAYCSNNFNIKLNQSLSALQGAIAKTKLNGIKFLKNATKQQCLELLEQAEFDFNMEIEQEKDNLLQICNICLRWCYFSVQQLMVNNTLGRYVRIPSIKEDQEDTEGSILLLKNENNNDELFLIKTSDDTLMFFIMEVKNQNINDKNIDTYIESIVEQFENKTSFEGDLWIPMFQTYSTNKLISKSNTTFSIRYNDCISCIKYNPTKKSKIFKPPFLAGLIQSTILEKLNKPLLTTLVSNENIQIDSDTIFNPIETELLQLKTQDQFKLDPIISKTHQSYIKSFLQKPPKELIKFQEPLILYVGTQGFVFLSIDQRCITARRWMINLIYHQDIQSFNEILKETVSFVFKQDKFADEIAIQLKHYPCQDDPDKLVLNKEFSDSLKQNDFKWKQQTNDSDTGDRLTSFLLRKNLNQIDKIGHFNEPIRLKSCYFIGESKREEQSQKIAIKNDLVEEIFNYFKKIPTQQTKLGEALKKNQGKLVATRQLLTDEQQAAQDFLKDLNMHNLAELKNGYRIFCQFTNIQLRWLQMRQVNLDGNKYLELPYNKEEENIVKGKNQFLKNDIYFLSTSDPKLTMFMVELDQDEFEKIQKNIEFYSSAIVQFTDNKQIVQQDMLIPEFDIVKEESNKKQFYKMILSTNYEYHIKSRINRPVNQDSMKLQLPLFVGFAHEDIVEKYELPLVSVVIQEYLTQ